MNGNKPMTALMPETRTGIIRVLGTPSEDAIIWDRDIPAQVEAAAARFAELLSVGCAAFTLEETPLRNGPLETQIAKFDPEYGEITVVAPLAGG